MVKAEQKLDLVEVNRIIKGESVQTVDVEYALSVLRSENARLREATKTAAEREAAKQRSMQIDHDHTRRELHKVHNELFASQTRVYELQKQLLTLRALVNEP